MKVLPTCTCIVAMTTLSYFTDQAASNVGKIRFTRMANYFLRPHQNLARVTNGNSRYSQLSPCGHLAITDTPIIRTAAKSQAKIKYRRLTEINSRYYGLSLMRTLTRGPYSVRYKGSWLYILFAEEVSMYASLIWCTKKWRLYFRWTKLCIHIYIG